MFKQHFGLKFNPFNKEIPIDKLFESRDMKELDSRLKYMLDTRGIGLIVGEPGSGKSTGLRKLVENVNHSLYKPCYLPLTTLTVKDFYQAMASLLGETPSHRKVKLFEQIQSCIQTLYYEQRVTPVFIIDEIHMAPTAILDDLRLLFNFKVDSANPFVMILSGQPPIRNKLALNTCYPLRQRITMRYSMQGLSAEETAEYCTSMMKAAGCMNEVFSASALAAIHTVSGGFPRGINNIAIASLMYCTQKKLMQVDEEIVYQANIEIGI
ncbi:MAG: AAA ATPase [Clostridiales bacterium 38_11]|nr:MAG: AAA ATPase [Clostridiales bacterium 38_11]HBH12095.1 AAA family ATPase [Clostridiales bacterium]